MAPFILIANLIEAQTDQIKELADSDDSWQLFRENELKSTNELNSTPLAGYQTAHNMDDEDSDDNHYETSMDKLFATFTSVKESYDSSRSNSEADVSVEEEKEESEEGENSEEESEVQVSEDEVKMAEEVKSVSEIPDIPLAQAVEEEED